MLRGEGGTKWVFEGVWLIEGDPAKLDVKVLETKLGELRVEANRLLTEEYQRHPDQKDEKAEFDLAAENKLRLLKSPLPALRESTIERKELAGAVFNDIRYDKDRQLHLSGYVTSPEQRTRIAEWLKDAKNVEPDILLKVGDKVMDPSPDSLRDFDDQKLKSELQKEFAGLDAKTSAALVQTRLDGAAFRYTKEGDGHKLSLRWRGVCLQGPKDTERGKAALKLLETELKARADGALPKLAPKDMPPTYLVDLEGMTFEESPVVSLQRRATADQRLDGVLFTAAYFDGEGKLLLDTRRDKDQVTALETFVKEGRSDATVSKRSSAWFDKGGWEDMRKALQDKLAAADRKDKAQLPLAQTRLDRAYFAYESSSQTPQLQFRGVRLVEDDKQPVPATALKDRLAAILKQDYAMVLLGGAEPISVEGVEPRKLPIRELQDQTEKIVELDGVLLRYAYYDATGTLQFVGLGFEDSKLSERMRKLIEVNVKERDILGPPATKKEADPKEGGAGPLQFSTSGLVAVPWKQLLKQLQHDFAGDTSKDSAIFQQTRLGRAHFHYGSSDSVLPIPASPKRTGLFLVRRDKIWMTRSISFLRPITGSSLPSRASLLRLRP